MALIAPLMIVLSTVIALLLILSAVYDLKITLQNKIINKASRRIRHPNQPRVSVIIYGKLSLQSLEDCLRSINRSRYRAIDIVVVGAPNNKLPRRTARELIARSKNRLVFYNMRSAVSESESIIRGCRKSLGGDVVFVVSPDMWLKPGSIKRAVARIQALGSSSALKIAIDNDQEIRVSSLASVMIAKSNHLARKARASIGFQGTRLMAGFAYPKDLLGSRRIKIPFVYDSQVVAFGRGHQGSSVVKMVLTALAMVVVGVVGLVALIAGARHITPVPFLLIFIVGFFWLTLVVWLDEYATMRRKLAISLTIIPGLFIIPINIVFDLFFRIKETLRATK